MTADSLMLVMAGSNGAVEMLGMFNDRLLVCRVWANTRRRRGMVGMGSMHHGGEGAGGGDYDGGAGGAGWEN